MKIFNFLFDPTKKLKKQVEEINALEKEISAMSDEAMKKESVKLRERAQSDTSLDELLPRAFALVRETAKRTLGQRHFDVQLMGGIVLHQGKIAEMSTGEGKTLAATAPVYLNALAGKGVHVVTVNEYLAKRDAVWMGQIYHALGMSVACLVHEGALLYDPDFLGNKSQIPNPKAQINSNEKNSKHLESALLDRERDITGGFLVQEEYLRPISRREAYQADITYGTNYEFGFDYLRDNLAYDLNQMVQVRRTNVEQTQNNAESDTDVSAQKYADRTPKQAENFNLLRNSALSQRESAIESTSHNFVIIDEVDSILIDEARTPLIISAPDTESSDYYRLFSKIANGLIKDDDYAVDEKYHSVQITESGIDKVEKQLKIKNIYDPENLRLTHYLEECLKAQALFKRDKDYVVKDGEIIIVDQNTGRLMLGRRYSSGLHQAIEAKEAVRVQQESRTYAQITIQNYFRLYKKLAGMTGTAQTSAEEFEKVYKLPVVTVPTNKPNQRQDLPDLIYKTADAKFRAVAKDIKERQKNGQPVLLGTISIEKNELLSAYLNREGVRHEILNAKNNEREGAIIAQAGKSSSVTLATNMAGRGVDIILGGNPPDIIESEKVKGLRGLHVIGTERHDARRIDNQLRGRCGRQGDPGSSQFFLSLEDDLMRIFGGDRIKNLMETLDVPEDMPVESGLVSKAVSQAQSRVEGFNFDARKHLLEYDDILNKQRLVIYEKRQQLLESGMVNVTSDKEEKIINLSHSALSIVLQMLDLLWMNHLENMEALRESVRLRAYGQHEPLVEYRRESHLLFQQLLSEFDQWIKENKERLEQSQKNVDSTQMVAENKFQRNSAFTPLDTKLSNGVNQRSSAPNFAAGKIGRNDPCPCGSGKKYKKCHGS